MSGVDTVGVAVFEGFEELDAVGPYDVFQTAGRAGAPVEARLLSVGDEARLTAAKGLGIEPDGRLPADPAADDAPEYLVVPGGGWNDRSDSGARAEVRRGVLPDRVAAYHDHGAIVASVCTGGMVLERAGLLDGRPAVTHHGALDELDASDARVAEARVVDAGDVLTCGGVTAGIDLALWLLEREWGPDVAAGAATQLEYERTSDVHRA